MYCIEYEVTKDGSPNYSPENILCRQLIFTSYLTPYQNENYRFVEYNPEELVKQNLTAVDVWEKKFGVRCDWEQIELLDGSKHWGWVLKE